MKDIYIGKILKGLTIFTIGFLSIVFSLLRNPTNRIFIPHGEINTTKYGVNLYEISGEFFVLGFPLNDFYYHGFSKSHLLDKVLGDKKEGLLGELVIELKDIFLNEKGARLIFDGKNREGKGKVDYDVRYFGNRVEIERNIALESNFDAIGQTITVCSGCYVTDDKNKVYLNQEFLTQSAINFASKMNLTPFIVGESQFFPTGASRIIILDRNGDTKMQIQIYPNERVSLQESWSLLEFRTPTEGTGHTKIKQIIYL
jgi:hypothetical protein